MNNFDAWHLPGLPSDALTEFGYLEGAGLSVRWPMLSAAQIERAAEFAREQRNQHLAKLSSNDIVGAIDAAAALLQAGADEHVQLLSAVTGYSEPVIAETLTHMFADWRRPALDTLLRSELGDARALDHAVPDARIDGKQIAAYGFPLTFHVFAGNVPGVAVTSLVRALLTKSAALGKTASDEPILPILFARALQHAAPRIASCLAVSYWPGGNAELEAAAIDAADAIIVYGGDDAVRSITARVTGQQRLIVHGPRISFGMIGTLADRNSTARAAAHAVAAYDQQGCVSPHVVYVVGTAANARAFAAAIAEQLKVLDATHPRGRVSMGDAVAIRNARTAAEFGNAEHAAIELFGSEGAGYSVIFEADPAFRASCLNRVLYVKPLRSAADITALLPAADLLQSAALAGFEDAEKAELIKTLGLAGVSRVTTFEQLPWPPMHWHHDGNGPLNELLRWQDVEG